MKDLNETEKLLQHFTQLQVSKATQTSPQYTTKFTQFVEKQLKTCVKLKSTLLPAISMYVNDKRIINKPQHIMDKHVHI